MKLIDSLLPLTVEVCSQTQTSFCTVATHTSCGEISQGSHLIEACHQVLHCIVTRALSGHGWYREGRLKARVMFALTLWTAQVFCKETEVVQGKNLPIQIVQLNY